MATALLGSLLRTRGPGRRLMRAVLICGVLVAAWACGGGESTSRPAPEDGAFCTEHGVPESVCTKCNPALIAVFRAKGDFCEEHGLPESVCPVCHPERALVPTSAVPEDGAPADGTRVRLRTKQAARLADLLVERVTARPTRSEIVATAKIAYDGTRVAQVNALSPGVVREIRTDVGARVVAGATLAFIESAGVGADQSRQRAARARLEVAETNHSRLAGLSAEGIAAQRDVLAARQELESARAELGSARAALGVVGGAQGGSRYALTAPIDGIVTERNATIGRLVGSEELLFEVVDTSAMWAQIDIPEAELPRVAAGQAVTIVVDGITDRELSGSLSYIAPAIDPRTRTAAGRVSLDNPDGLLRANMFARARVAVSEARVASMVPRAAVQRAGDAHMVFVRLADDLYEARRVELGQADGELIEVSGRLRPGDEVVTQGSFLLKTETLKEGIGAGCCEVEEGH